MVDVSKTSVISIVDDDESVREALESFLKSLGFKAEVFASAEEFLKVGPFSSTDCLILDMRMPGMSGLELQRQLVINNHDIPIIFITAHGDEEARSQVLKDGAVDYLLKPFSEEALLRAINTALQSK
jgi:FixJ family two-component response regulator